MQLCGCCPPGLGSRLRSLGAPELSELTRRGARVEPRARGRWRLSSRAAAMPVCVASSWVGTPGAPGACGRRGRSGVSSRPGRHGPPALDASCERGIGESAGPAVGHTVQVAAAPLWPGGGSLPLEVRPRRSPAHVQSAERPFKLAAGGDVLTALGTAHREFAQRKPPSPFPSSLCCSLSLPSLAAVSPPRAEA